MHLRTTIRTVSESVSKIVKKTILVNVQSHILPRGQHIELHCLLVEKFDSSLFRTVKEQLTIMQMKVETGISDNIFN